MATELQASLDKPIPQHPVWSWYAAWEAVHAQTPLEEYLLFRFRIYESEGRRSFHPLPYDIAIIAGRLVLTPNPEYEPYWQRLMDESAGDQGVPYLSPIEQMEIARELEQIELQLQAVTARLHALSDMVDRLEIIEASAILTGEIPGPATLDRHDKRRCQKKLPFPWQPVLGYLAIIFLVLVELFQLTWPFLDMQGIDTGNLSAEWERSPIAILGGVACAFAATTGLMFCWHLLMSEAQVLSSGWQTEGAWSSAGKLVRLAVIFVFLLYGTFLISSLRHGQAVSASAFADTAPGESTSHPGAGVFVFLSLLVPAAGAYIERRTAQSSCRQRRSEIQAENEKSARAQDQEHLGPDQKANGLALFRIKRSQLEQDQERLEARRRALADHVRVARDHWLNSLKTERRATELFWRTLVAALELDRSHFFRFARKTGAVHLLSMDAPCPPRGSNGSSFTQHHGPSREDIPSYQVVRPLLTGKRHSDES